MGAFRREKVFVFSVIAAVLCLFTGRTWAKNIIERVNEDNKSFSGIWVHKIRTPGQPKYDVITRVRIEVKGKKFRLRYLDGGEGECIYDGKDLYLIRPAKKEAARLGMEHFGTMPFWKMSGDAEPLIRTMYAGEQEVAGRVCYVFTAEGDYPRGKVSVTYWVDKETDILLKKEYVLIIGDELFVREAYESEEVEPGRDVPEEEFEVQLSGDWKKIEGPRPDLDMLKTKF